jgi:hypothetical protein
VQQQPHQCVVVLDLLHGRLSGQGALEHCILVQLLKADSAAAEQQVCRQLDYRLGQLCHVNTNACCNLLRSAALRVTKGGIQAPMFMSDALPEAAAPTPIRQTGTCR